MLVLGVTFVSIKRCSSTVRSHGFGCLARPVARLLTILPHGHCCLYFWATVDPSMMAVFSLCDASNPAGSRVEK